MRSRPIRIRGDAETERRLRRLLSQSPAPLRVSEADLIDLGLVLLLGDPDPVDSNPFESAVRMDIERKRSDLKRLSDQVAELRPQVASLLSSLETYETDSEMLSRATEELKEQISRARGTAKSRPETSVR